MAKGTTKKDKRKVSLLLAKALSIDYTVGEIWEYSMVRGDY
jgi:hypothetical protein